MPPDKRDLQNGLKIGYKRPGIQMRLPGCFCLNEARRAEARKLQQIQK